MIYLRGFAKNSYPYIDFYCFKRFIQQDLGIGTNMITDDQIHTCMDEAIQERKPPKVKDEDKTKNILQEESSESEEVRERRPISELKLLRPQFIEALARVALILYPVVADDKRKTSFYSLKNFFDGPLLTFKNSYFLGNKEYYKNLREQFIWQQPIAKGEEKKANSEKKSDEDSKVKQIC